MRERAVARAALEPADLDVLFEIAGESIASGLAGDGPLAPSADDRSPGLVQMVGSFVTLHIDDDLNGCIGSIEGVEALVRDVAHHAWAAAFDDPRLPGLRRDELDRLTTEISVLSPLEPIAAGTRAEVVGGLRPRVDGLLIAAGRSRAVFLPAVWRSIPVPDRFVDQLLAKAGLDPARWPPGLEAWRFTADEYERSG